MLNGHESIVVADGIVLILKKKRLGINWNKLYCQYISADTNILQSLSSLRGMMKACLARFGGPFRYASLQRTGDYPYYVVGIVVL